MVFAFLWTLSYFWNLTFMTLEIYAASDEEILNSLGQGTDNETGDDKTKYKFAWL